MSTIDVSVVVPCYNEERYIAECLEAILAQDYPEDRYEILVVDNNSTDRSAEIARRYPRVRLLSESAPGDFAARNRGLAESGGRIIAFTDADTAPAPDWVRRIVEVMRDPQVRLVIGTLLFASDSRALALMAEYEAQKNEYIFSASVKELYYGYTCNLAVRRSVFDDLGPFASMYRSADVVLVRRVVDEWSCQAAVFSRAVRVRRLEVATLLAYLGKTYVYGRDLRSYQAVANARPLVMRERLAVYRRARRNMGLSSWKSTVLFGLLAVGAVCYEAGRLRRTRTA